MNLSDIGKSPDSTFRKINLHLQANYGFKISEDSSDKDLVSIMEQIQDEITDLKVKGNDSKNSPEISKRLLVLEGITSLREFAMMQFQSPKLNSVITNLVDFVVDTFEVSGFHGQVDFEKALQHAMDEYRSSRYRFPDEMIEQRVRQEAMTRIQAEMSQDAHPGDHMMEDSDDADAEDDSEMKGIDLEEAEPNFGSVGKRASALGGHAAQAPNTPAAKHALKVLDNPALSYQGQPSSDDQVPMVRDQNGRMVPKASWMAPSRRRTNEGTEMKANLVKNLRRLLETEVSQAEVMMAAKGFAQELQEMVEKIGRLQNEDLPPVTDQMRETYGMESASAFQTQIYGALQSVMDALYTAKGQVDDAVTNMAQTGQFDAQTDMDVPMDGMDDGMGADPMAMDAGAGDEADLDNLAGDMDSADEFGGAEEEQPLGRGMKTEAIMQKKVLEMQKLVAKARKLREARG